MKAELKSEGKAKAPWIRDLGQGMKDAGRNVWLAGLGAASAVDEGSRGLFSGLVERGQRFQDRERPALEDRFRQVGDRIETFRHKVEHNVEHRLASAFKRFGVPDRDEVQQLIERIERLTRKVEDLAKART